MASVFVYAGQAAEFVGEFEFDQVPRPGDDITVPWPSDPHGVRIFDVEAISHIAAGVDSPIFGVGPRTILRLSTEIT